MNHVTSLAAEELERLQLALEASIRVSRRSQFYLWVQGALQSFLPHETLVCVCSTPDDPRPANEVFSRGLIPAVVEGILADPNGAIVAPLRQAWQRAGQIPLTMPSTAFPPLLADASLGEGGLLCHGVGGSNGVTTSFFVFLGWARAPGPRERYLVELLMPHLHLALLRMHEGEQTVAGVATTALLSSREAQVLGWMRDGKTNQQIGRILDISPLTVKNHVQSILRKLNANNRAQAVASGVASGLIAGRVATRD